MLRSLAVPGDFMTAAVEERLCSQRVEPIQRMEASMAQKGAGGNAGAITKKGGDKASGSTGTGRGGGKGGNAGKKG